MVPVTLAPGTWGGDWVKPGSPVRKFLKCYGIECFWFQGWDTNVDGLPKLLNPWQAEKHASWIAGGYSMGYKFEDMPYEDRIVLAHSHGGNVAFNCAGLAKVKIHTLITICTPVRSDMDEVMKAARPNIGFHRHITADGWDFWQRAGEFMDGHFGWQREMPYADENIKFKGIGHSKLLNNDEKFPLLATEKDGHAATTKLLKEACRV